MNNLDQPWQETQGCFGFCTNADEPSSFDFLRDNKNQTNSRQDVLSNRDQQTKQEIEAMLSDALNILTFEERQEQQKALNGVDDKIKEEATFIETSLNDLDNCLPKG
jgi:hypothetical protein